jgi:hypothetical protein
MSHVHLAMRIGELVDDNPDLSIHDVMLAITLARQGQPAADKTLATQRYTTVSNFSWYDEFKELMILGDWLRALELVAFWHFDGLMSAGYFNSE